MFQKNLEFLTEEQAEKISRRKVAVVGTGALGQMAAHELVRCLLYTSDAADE